MAGLKSKKYHIQLTKYSAWTIEKGISIQEVMQSLGYEINDRPYKWYIIDENEPIKYRN